jgi:hypothetical protein
MARLIVKTDGVTTRVMELKLGVNRLGRNPESDFVVDHPTVSGTHCEVELVEGRVRIRDCHSTNGTFAGGQQVQEAQLSPGQTFRIGDVEILIETTEVNIAIPQFIPTSTAEQAPTVLLDASSMCVRHPQNPVKYRCSHCQISMCGECVRHFRRKNGEQVKRCSRCGEECEALDGSSRKQGFLEKLARTVKMSFSRR